MSQRHGIILYPWGCSTKKDVGSKYNKASSRLAKKQCNLARREV